MNEEAQKVLVSMMQSLMESVQSGADVAVEFSKEQIPDVLNQLLLWHMSLSAIVTVFTVVVFGLLGRWGYKLMTMTSSEMKERDVSRDDVGAGIFIVGITGFLYSMIMLFNLDQLTNWLQILVAPKLYLLEYGAELIKEMNN